MADLCQGASTSQVLLTTYYPNCRRTRSPQNHNSAISIDNLTVHIMRHITHLPTDILIYIGEFLEEATYNIYDDKRYRFAAVLNDLDMIQHYFLKNENEKMKNLNLITNVVSVGNLIMIQWLHRNGCPWDEGACYWAARNGHLEVLKYLHDNGCPWDARACERAARNGQLEVLKYLHDNGCPWDSLVCERAAENGHLEVLEYLHDNGCRWDGWAYLRAAENGHIEVLKYLHDNGCPWDVYACAGAAENGQLEVLEYLLANG
jgi:hypothetical protein